MKNKVITEKYIELVKDRVNIAWNPCYNQLDWRVANRVHTQVTVFTGNQIFNQVLNRIFVENSKKYYNEE